MRLSEADCEILSSMGSRRAISTRSNVQEVGGILFIPSAAR